MNEFHVPVGDNHSQVIAAHSARFEQLLSKAIYKTDGIAVDAGAHVGFWTIRMASVFEYVVAFEPRDENFDCLRLNIDEKRGRIFAVHAALGASPGMCSVQGNTGQDLNNTGAYHVVEGGSTPVLALDDFCFPVAVNLIKLDVEGFESHVIAGACETIHRDSPVIIMECTNTSSLNYGWDDNEAEGLILDEGYSLVAEMGRDRIYMK